MTNPEKIIILDFNNNDILILDYDSNLYHNIEDFFLTEEISDANISINNCEYMILPVEQFQIKFSLD